VDKFDRKILNEIQSDFPITSRPYKELGERVNLSEKDVFDRIERLRQGGVIRRIGGSFSSNKLNYTSTLCAASVPDDKIEMFVNEVNKFPGVTHNYLRNNNLNIWFTFIAKDMTYIKNALKKIGGKTGVSEIYNLPAVNSFKIKVDFKV
jgi:DNA-binding Lrp family transcriptional regulator